MVDTWRGVARVRRLGRLKGNDTRSGLGMHTAFRETRPGLLLDSFLRSRHCVPQSARRIHTPRELPLPLQSRMTESHDAVWRALSDGSRTRFVKARSVAYGYSAGLHVMLFEVDGRLVSSATWVRVPARGWVFSHRVAAT